MKENEWHNIEDKHDLPWEEECMSLEIKTEKSKKYIFYGMIMMIAI